MCTFILSLSSVRVYESQLRLMAHEDGSLFEDMHGQHEDQAERLKIVQTRMQTDMGGCTYTGLGPRETKSIKKSS